MHLWVHPELVRPQLHREAAKAAAEAAMKRLEERERQLKIWEEEMINKAKDEAARINEEAKDRENDAKALEKQIIGTKRERKNGAELFNH